MYAFDVFFCGVLLFSNRNFRRCEKKPDFGEKLKSYMTMSNGARMNVSQSVVELVQILATTEDVVDHTQSLLTVAVAAGIEDAMILVETAIGIDILASDTDIIEAVIKTSGGCKHDLEGMSIMSLVTREFEAGIILVLEDQSLPHRVTNAGSSIMTELAKTQSDTIHLSYIEEAANLIPIAVIGTHLI